METGQRKWRCYVMGFDFQHLIELLPDINKAFLQTIYMIGISLAVADCHWIATRDFIICY